MPPWGVHAKCWGTDFAGTVESLGRSVTQVQPGDGADTVIDYTKEDFTRSGQRYDPMLDIAGNRSWSECRPVLDAKATFVGVGAAGVQYHSTWRALSHLVNVTFGVRG